MTVTAHGNESGTAFARQVDSLLAIAPNTVQLSGDYADAPQEPDSDGQFARLDLQIGVVTAQAGSYLLSGDLFTTDSVLVAHGVISHTLSAGASAVVLPFNGEAIRRSERNGPYTLTNLTISDLQHAGIPTVWREQNAWTTQAYFHGMFGALQKVLLPLVLR